MTITPGKDRNYPSPPDGSKLWKKHNGGWVHIGQEKNSDKLTHYFGNSDEINEVDYLVTIAGEDIDQRDDLGLTPLMHAAWFNHSLALVEKLISLGADVNARNVDGVTPLMLAATPTIYGIADFSDDKDYWRTPNLRDMVKLLIDAGGDCNAVDCHGKTAITHLTSYDPLLKDRKICEVLELLISQGADVNAALSSVLCNSFDQEDIDHMDSDDVAYMLPKDYLCAYSVGNGKRFWFSDHKKIVIDIASMLLDAGASLSREYGLEIANELPYIKKYDVYWRLLESRFNTSKEVMKKDSSQDESKELLGFGMVPAVGPVRIWDDGSATIVEVWTSSGWYGLTGEGRPTLASFDPGTSTIERFRGEGISEADLNSFK